MWFNITLHCQSDLYVIIGQLECALLQLTKTFDELPNAIQ